MAFELWSTASKNLLGDFATEAEALATVRAAVQAHGAAYADDLLLARETTRGETRILARGAVLRERAFASASSSRLKTRVAARRSGGLVPPTGAVSRRTPVFGQRTASAAAKGLRNPTGKAAQDERTAATPRSSRAKRS